MGCQVLSIQSSKQPRLLRPWLMYNQMRRARQGAGSNLFISRKVPGTKIQSKHKGIHVSDPELGAQWSLWSYYSLK